MARTPRKRTAGEVSQGEEPPKKSNKTPRLAEIRAKVREGYAKEDKARLEASKAKHTQDVSGKPASAKSSPAKKKKSPAPPPAKSKKKESLAEMKARLHADPTVNKAAAAKSPAGKKRAATSKSPAPTKKKADAKSPAQGKKSAPAAAAAPPPAVAAPVMSPVSSPPVNTFPTSGYLSPEMMMLRQQFAHLTSPQLQQTPQYQQLMLARQAMLNQQGRQYNNALAASMSYRPANMNFGMGSIPMAQMQMAQMQQAAAAAPAVASPKPKATSSRKRSSSKKPPAKKNNQDSEDDVVPAAPALQRNISQKVMENAAAASKGQDPPHQTMPLKGLDYIDQDDNDPSPAVVDDQPIEVDGVDDSDNAVELYENQRRFKKIVYASGAAALAVAVAVLLQHDSGSTSHTWKSPFAATEEASCYISQNGDAQFCTEQEQEGVPCPTGAICEMGQFKGCDKFYTQVGKRHACELDDAGKTLLDTLANQITVQSKQHETCDPDNRPLFYYADLQKLDNTTLPLESEYLIDFLKTNEFVVQQTNNHLVTGLPIEHPGNRLPLRCHAEAFARQSLEKIGSGLWASTRFVCATVWSLSSAYPLYSAIGFVFVVLFFVLQYKRAGKAKLKLDVANVEEMAYGKLVDDPGRAHIVVHIRDEIARNLHPNSRKGQEHIVGKVWPRVVKEMKRDTRIKKSTKMMDGQLRDVWQWTAAPPSTGKTARFASNEQ